MKTRRSHSLMTCAGGLAAACVLAATAPAAAQLRYATTTPGGIASTGNTLGLSKALNLNGPGVEDSIGAFISLDPTSVDAPLNALNPWPAYTTAGWTQNGSEGVLALPPGSEVLYAELVWGGSYRDFAEDVSAFIDSPVDLLFNGDVMSVAPSNVTALTIDELSFTGFAARYYIRSADVTPFVQQHESGTYGVGGVAATQSTGINSLNAAGWSLVVAYRNEGQPIRNLSVFVGGSFVDEDSQQDYTIAGFCAPPFGPVEGKVVLSALEGDADLMGDDLLVAPTDAGPFVNLSGPNNPATNFFCSQINDDDGNLDTQGSFGLSNHDAFNGVNVPGGRQGWDLTTVALSSEAGHLFNGQTSAVVRTNTTGDSFVPALAAIEIDVKSPDFEDASTESDRDPVSLGDSFFVTVQLSNSGEAPAMNLQLSLPLDGGLSLVDYTTDGVQGDIDGNTVTGQQVVSGVPAGTLNVGETRIIRLGFEVIGEPANGQSFVFAPSWEHSFVMCDGDAPIVESYGSEILLVGYQTASGEGGGGADGTGAGGTGAGGMGAGGTGGSMVEDDGNDIEEMGGCGCKVAGERHDGSVGWLLLPALLALFGARRRRRS